MFMKKPIPLAAHSKAWVCGRRLGGIVGYNPAGGTDVCCECCVLSGRDLCVGLISRAEESYRVWCACDREDPSGEAMTRNRVKELQENDFCLTVHHQLGKVIQMNQLDATMIY
jgi:hypothetical protein